VQVTLFDDEINSKTAGIIRTISLAAQAVEVGFKKHRFS